MISIPPNQVMFDSDSKPNPMWVEFMSEAYKGIAATQSSGTTAQRPTKNLFTGRFYFDTTLGYPVWYKTSGWVNASGASV